MKLFAYLGSVLAVIGLVITFLTQRDLVDLRRRVQELQPLKSLAPGDDQPVTVVGGSLFLGNDPTAKWDIGANQTLVYNADQISSVNKIDIISATNADDDAEYQLTRMANTSLIVDTKYGPGGTSNKFHLVRLETNAAGKALKLSVKDDAGTVIDPKKFMRMLTFLRRHPKKSWQIQSVKVTGASANPVVYTPIGGDISVLLHYCSGC